MSSDRRATAWSVAPGVIPGGSPGSSRRMSPTVDAAARSRRRGTRRVDDHRAPVRVLEPGRDGVDRDVPPPQLVAEGAWSSVSTALVLGEIGGPTEVDQRSPSRTMSGRLAAHEAGGSQAQPAARDLELEHPVVAQGAACTTTSTPTNARLPSRRTVARRRARRPGRLAPRPPRRSRRGSPRRSTRRRRGYPGRLRETA